MLKVQQATRTRIAEFLPDAIAAALKTYQEFLSQGPEKVAKEEEPEKIKNFKAHIDACKVAAAHISLLIKMAEWADLPDATLEDQSHQQLLRAVLSSAKEELENNPLDEEQEEQDEDSDV